VRALVRLDQGDHDVEPLARRRAGLGTHQGLDLLQRRPKVGLGLDGPAVHARLLQIVGASIASYA
jgi:hypothetical protein